MKKLLLTLMLLPAMGFAATEKTLARVYTGYIYPGDAVGAMVEKGTGKVLMFKQTVSAVPDTLDKSCWYLIEYGSFSGKLTLLEVTDIHDCGHDFGGDK